MKRETDGLKKNEAGYDSQSNRKRKVRKIEWKERIERKGYNGNILNDMEKKSSDGV